MKRIFLSLLFLYLLAPLPGYAVTPPAHLLQQLKAGDYASLDRLITSQQYAYETGARNELEILQTLNTFHSSNDGLEGLLNKWVAHNPDTYPAYLARGSHYVHIAGLLRGTKFANKTSKQQFANMRRYHNRALEDFNTALSLNPKLMYAYSMLIRIATSSGTERDIYRLSHDALQIDPSSYLVHRQVMFKLQPKWGGSTKRINKWLVQKIKPQLRNNPLLKALLGYPEYLHAEKLRYKNKQPEQATEFYTQAVTASDGNYNVLFLLERGEHLYYQKDYDLALTDLNKTLNQYPYYVSALKMRGKILNAMGRHYDALRDLDLAISLDQYHPKLRRARAYIHRNLKMYKQALQDAEASLKYGASDSKNWVAKAYTLLYGKKDNSAAEAAYTKAIELNPKNKRSWYNLGVAQYRLLSCDFMTSIEVYLDLCKAEKCEKNLTDWSRSSLKMAVDKGYCEKLQTASPE